MQAKSNESLDFFRFPIVLFVTRCFVFVVFLFVFFLTRRWADVFYSKAAHLHRHVTVRRCKQSIGSRECMWRRSVAGCGGQQWLWERLYTILGKERRRKQGELMLLELCVCNWYECVLADRVCLFVHHIQRKQTQGVMSVCCLNGKCVCFEAICMFAWWLLFINLFLKVMRNLPVRVLRTEAARWQGSNLQHSPYHTAYSAWTNARWCWRESPAQMKHYQKG